MNHPSAAKRFTAERMGRDETAQDGITLITGCMFSGKTTELLRILKRYPTSVRVALKPAIDTRYNPTAIVTHDGESVSACTVATSVEILDHIHEATKVLALDEAHFLDPGLPTALADVKSRGIHVLVASLDLNSWGQVFESIEAVRRRADSTITRSATCTRCGDVATRTQRTTPVVDDQMVGGAESYEPRCPGCWTPPPNE